MRFKPVPEPPATLDAVEEAGRAVGLVADPEADCCARIRERLGLCDREAARTWLAFLRALESVERTPDGYRRRRGSLDEVELRTAFRDRVYAAPETIDALDDEPRSAATVAEAVAERIGGDRRAGLPAWERQRAVNPGEAWRSRTTRLLGWCVRFGLAKRNDDGYVATDTLSADDTRGADT